MVARECKNELVIGLTGPVGAGVSTLSQLLSRRGFHRISLSAPMKDELRRQSDLSPDAEINEQTVPGFRAKLQDIGNKGREVSPSHWVEEALKTVPSESDVVIDGIRNMGEVDALRDRYRKFFLVAVHASKATRWERVKHQYDGHQKLFDRDDQRDSGKGEDKKHGQQVGKCVEDADYVMNNDEHFRGEAIEKQLSEVIDPDLILMRDSDRIGADRERHRPPEPEEGHMAAAYAQAHISRCIKRHVGAVIVSKDDRPLSMGYNENPFTMKPCISEYRGCFKDLDMDDKLAKMTDFFCPYCGAEIHHVESPWSCPRCQENLKLRFFPDRNLQVCTAIHAEERAISSLEGRNAEGGTVYTTTFPCFQCARKIVDAGISRVVFVEAYPIQEAYEFLQKRGVTIEPFHGFKARAFNLVFRQVE